MKFLTLVLAASLAGCCVPLPLGCAEVFGSQEEAPQKEECQPNPDDPFDTSCMGEGEPLNRTAESSRR